MYGLVNKAVQDLAVAAGGEETWTAIRTRAGLADPSFVAMEPYDDAVTYRLVQAAAEHFGWAPETVLEAFGEHWITYTAREGYGPLLATMGDTLPAFLGSLDAMHSRIRLTMPALRPPSFVCEEVDPGHLRLHYYSDRAGLAPMVVGLLRGLGRMLAVTVDVRHGVDDTDGDAHDVFDVLYRPAAPAGVPDEPLAGVAVP